MNQMQLAEELAANLEECGHDDISALDLLDSMASVGMKLVPDTSEAASTAYLLALTEEADHA